MIVTVAVVNEQVHQRARREEQVRQSTEDMRGMLCNQKESRDTEEAAENDSIGGAPPGRLSLLIHRSSSFRVVPVTSCSSS